VPTLEDANPDASNASAKASAAEESTSRPKPACAPSIVAFPGTPEVKTAGRR